MTLFKNKYRIESTRLQSWDYASKGMYFVTICTKERECYFGNIDKGEMNLSGIGKIAEIEWCKTPELRPDMNLELGEFVVMPNHVHGIIMIGENKYNHDEMNNRRDAISGRDAMHRVSANHIDAIDRSMDAMRGGDSIHGTGAFPDGDPMHRVSTNHTSVIPTMKFYTDTYKNQFGPQRKNLSSILRGYKSAITTWARKNKMQFKWQERFHDHIIRTDEDFHRISEYIRKNPIQWEQDHFFKEH